MHAEAQASGGRRARRPRAALGRPQAGNAVRRAPLGLPGACVRSCGSARGRGGRRSSAACSGRPCDSSPRRQRDGTALRLWNTSGKVALPQASCERSGARDGEGSEQADRGARAISREDSAASRLSGAHPARSRSSRWGVGVAARSWAALTAPALSKGPPCAKGRFFFTGAPPLPLQLPSYSPTC